MSAHLDPFYLIVDGAHWIERLAPHGLKLVQLRIKDAPQSVLRDEIRRARDVCARHNVTLVVNDHWRLAIKEGCDFVHLGQEDLADADLDALRGAGCKLGLSTHDTRELDVALEAKPDYIALGPVFPTTLKQLDWEPQGVARVGEWRAMLHDTPLVAIGGMTPDRARQALAAGANSVAVSTDVLQNPDPEARTREWVAGTRLSLPGT
jgi:thiamine-phosphate pyrophosphorylase